MSYGPTSVQEFISSIDKGEYVIPHFQRDFEWAPNMVSALFNSILQESYAGTVLIWLLGDPQRGREMWEPLWGAKKSNRPIKAVLDGQQRLSLKTLASKDGNASITTKHESQNASRKINKEEATGIAAGKVPAKQDVVQKAEKSLS